jgi:hypothetical protein
MSRNLLLDPRYRPFVERYAADPLRFLIEVCLMRPSEDQADLAMFVAPPDAKVSVVSGTGTGKSAGLGRIALWHLLCFPYANVEGKAEIGSNTYIGAPVMQQVADSIWKEMKDADLQMASSPHGWIRDYFVITKTRVYVVGYSEQWFIGQVAFRKGEAVSIAGKHRYWQMIIVDEAAGVPDEHYDVIDGTQTSPGNRTILASQGAKNTGRFYDTHHKLSVANGGAWDSLRFSSERSPFVTDKWLAARLLECGGRDSLEYRIRVRGQFFDGSSSYLLTRDDVEAMLKLSPVIGPDEPYGVIQLSDVALGEYRDDSVLLVAKVIGYEDFGLLARRVHIMAVPICDNDKNEVDLAGDVVNNHKALGAQGFAPLTYMDNGGIGHAVATLVERSLVPVNRIDWGAPCFREEYQKRYFNQRACANVRLRDAIRQGRVSVDPAVPDRVRQKLLEQGARLPYHFSESGGLRYVMRSKKDMADDGIKSPDVWDTLAFCFLEMTTYIALSAVNPEKASLSSALERMRAMRAQEATPAG